MEVRKGRALLLFVTRYQALLQAPSSIALGAAFSLGFAPVGWWPVSLAALASFGLLLGQRMPLIRAIFFGWCFFAGFLGTSLHWLHESFAFGPPVLRPLGPVLVGALAAGLALYGAIFGAAAQLAPKRGLLRSIFVGASWTLVEFLRFKLLTGFPWNPLAAVWVETPSLLQVVSLTGVFGLSFLTATLAFGLGDACRAFLTGPGGRTAGAAGVTALFCAAAGIYHHGNQRLRFSPGESNVTVRVVQPNIPQDLKWSTREAEKFLGTYRRLSGEGDGNVNLVLWPESALPFYLDEHPAILKAIAASLPLGATLALGGDRRESPGDDEYVYNSIFTLLPDGRLAGKPYDKIRLVPFGEYIPLSSINPFPRVAHGIRDFTAGTGRDVIPIADDVKIAPLICYEAAFPGDLRSLAAEATVIANVTNDAWFGTSWGPAQHFALSRMRAVELGIPLVRAANTGISAVVDAFGRVVAQTELNTQTVITARVPAPIPGRTAYVRWGDLPVLCLASLVIALGLARRRREVRGQERRQQRGCEVLSYRGISLVLRRTPREWIVYVGAASGPRIIAGADRGAALSRAKAWVDVHLKNS